MAFMGAQSAIYNKSVGESVPADRLDNEVRFPAQRSAPSELQLNFRSSAGRPP